MSTKFLVFLVFLVGTESAYSDNDEIEFSGNLRKDVNSEQILINVNHVIEFLQSIKKAQESLYKKVDLLAKSVESADREEYRSRTRLSQKLTALESRVNDIERSLTAKIEQVVKTHFQNNVNFNNAAPTSRPVYAGDDNDDYDTPWTTTTRSAELEPVREREPIGEGDGEDVDADVDFLPPVSILSPRVSPPSPFLKMPLLGGAGRTSRNVAYYEPFRNSHGHSGHRANFLRGSPGVADRQGYLSIQLLEESRAKMNEFNSTLEDIKYKVSSVERAMQQFNNSRQGNSDFEDQLSSNTRDVQTVRQKQGEMQRALDTVLIHFSTMILGLEKAQKSIDETRENFTAEIQSFRDSDSNSNVKTSNSNPNFTAGAGHLPTHTYTHSNPFNRNENDWRSGEYPYGRNFNIDTTTTATTMTYNHADKYTTVPPPPPVFESEDVGVGLGVEGIYDYDESATAAPDRNYRYDEDEDPSNAAEDFWAKSSEGEYEIRRMRPSASALRADPPPQPQPSNTRTTGTANPNTKLQTKSPGVTPRGNDRGTRNILELNNSVNNLTAEFLLQKEQLSTLTNELMKVNVSHMLLLRTMDEETLKRTIRPKDCSEIRLFRNGSKAEKFTIYPRLNVGKPVDVVCDLETEGGGWTVIQRRGHPLKTEGELRENFFRNWTDYERGFGSIDGDYWIGLKDIAALTRLGDQELRVELTKWNGVIGTATYSNFQVADESRQYALNVSGYSGNAGDSLTRHNGMKFSTMDSDHDTDPQRNCAQMWNGAWWYHGCHESNLNGLYGTDDSSGTHDFGTGVIWYTFTGNYYSLKQVEIKIRNRFVHRP